MSCVLNKESITAGLKIYEVSAQERIENEINLPDYCQDIKKLLRCNLVPGVHTVSVSGERVNLRGTAVLRVLYLAEGDKADIFEKNIDLTMSAQMKDIPDMAVVTAKMTVDFVNCRALSQRKFSISAGVSSLFSCYCGKTEEYVKSCEEKSLQIKTENAECENLLGFYEKVFDMSETVALNSENPPVGRIVSTVSHSENQSCKLSSGKLLIKADIITMVRYIPENSPGSFHHITHSMPLSQIIDVKDLPDGADCDITINVNQVLCNVKSDSSGNNRLVELSLRIGAFIRATEKRKCEVVTDCYCTDCDIDPVYEKPGMLLCVRDINETGQAKSVAELPSSVKEICFADCTEMNTNIRYNTDKAELNCSALVFIMYTDENGVPCCCEKNIDFDINYSIVKKCNEPLGNFDIQPLTLYYSVESDNKAELKLDYRVHGKIYDRHEGKVLKDVSFCPQDGKRTNDAALTLYYCDGGEKLWDIAKSHNTTVSLIKEENGIKKDTVEGKMMLLIPCV